MVHTASKPAFKCPVLGWSFQSKESKVPMFRRGLKELLPVSSVFIEGKRATAQSFVRPEYGDPPKGPCRRGHRRNNASNNQTLISWSFCCTGTLPCVPLMLEAETLLCHPHVS